MAETRVGAVLLRRRRGCFGRVQNALLFGVVAAVMAVALFARAVGLRRAVLLLHLSLLFQFGTVGDQVLRVLAVVAPLGLRSHIALGRDMVGELTAVVAPGQQP